MQWQQRQVNEVDNVYDEATAYMYHSVYDEANHMTYDGRHLCTEGIGQVVSDLMRALPGYHRYCNQRFSLRTSSMRSSGL